MAKWAIAKIIDLRPCACGSNDITLWNDSGTNWFFLKCSNDDCEAETPKINIDTGESYFDLKQKWQTAQ